MFCKGAVVIVIFCLFITKAKGDDDGDPMFNFFFGDDGQDNNANQPVTDPPVPHHTHMHPEPITRNDTTIYVHWGRSDCIPETSDVVYSGYLGGGSHSSHGSGTNALCLPESPEYDSNLYDSSFGGSNVYGAEFETSDYSPLSHLHDGDVTCAVCLANGRLTTLMIPAKTTCPLGWTKEYGGLLMGSHTSHSGGHEYLCIDANPEAQPGSTANSNGFLLYAAEGVCGSLPCPPYIAGNALACVVCTR